MIFPSAKLKEVFMLTLQDFIGNRLQGKLKRRKVFWANKIHPIVIKSKLFLLLETELGHLYLEKWKSKKPFIYSIDWRVDTASSPTRLIINWLLENKGRNVAYSYMLDKRKDSEPIPEFKMLSGEQVTYQNPKDGFYSFHLHMKDAANNQELALYHIPIYWQYRPEAPQVGLVKELGPNLIKPTKKVKFFVKNERPLTYYAEINSIPKYDPKKKAKLKKEIFQVKKRKKKLKPGRYYLHVRACDKRSGQFSSTTHHLFFVHPYNPAQDDSLKESNKKIGELEFILKKIRENRDNPEEQKKWIQKLKDLQKQIEK